MEGIGKALLFVGVAVALLGLLLLLGPKIPLVGRLPGDLIFRRGDSVVYLPIATSIVVSIVLTALVSVDFRLFK